MSVHLLSLDLELKRAIRRRDSGEPVFPDSQYESPLPTCNREAADVQRLPSGCEHSRRRGVVRRSRSQLAWQCHGVVADQEERREPQLGVALVAASGGHA